MKKTTLAMLSKYFLEVSSISYKKLNLVGVGYKVFFINDQMLHFKLGFSHNIYYKVPKGLVINVSIFHSLGFPILVGNSRKRFIKDITKKNDSFTRIGGTISSSLYLMTQGVQILRIHDVNEVMQAIKVFKEITNK